MAGTRDVHQRQPALGLHAGDVGRQQDIALHAVDQQHRAGQLAPLLPLIDVGHGLSLIRLKRADVMAVNAPLVGIAPGGLPVAEEETHRLRDHAVVFLCGTGLAQQLRRAAKDVVAHQYLGSPPPPRGCNVRANIVQDQLGNLLRKGMRQCDGDAASQR